MEKAWDASLNLKRIFVDVDRAARWNTPQGSASSKPGLCLMCGEIETHSADQVCAVCKVTARARERVVRGDVEALVFYHGGGNKGRRLRGLVAA